MMKAMGKGGLKGMKGAGKFAKKLLKKTKNKDGKEVDETIENMFGGFQEELDTEYLETEEQKIEEIFERC